MSDSSVTQYHSPLRVCRNVRPSVTATIPDVLAHGWLEIRVCVRTYRLFYVPHTEDFLWHVLSGDEQAGMGERRAKLKERQRTWAREVEAGRWLSERRTATGTGAGEGEGEGEVAVTATVVPEGDTAPGTGEGEGTEAGPGPSVDGSMNPDIEVEAIDSASGGSVNVVSAP
jgi:hypothetical protein